MALSPLPLRCMLPVSVQPPTCPHLARLLPLITQQPNSTAGGSGLPASLPYLSVCSPSEGFTLTDNQEILRVSPRESSLLTTPHPS